MLMIITCAIIASTKEFGFKNNDFGGLSPGPEALKPFLIRVAKVAA
jgi:hypothetical protein